MQKTGSLLVHTPGTSPVPGNASRIVARVLQRSAINEPTWTGHHGTAGGPAAAQPRRFGNTVNPALRAAMAAQQERQERGDGADEGEKTAAIGRRFNTAGVRLDALAWSPDSYSGDVRKACPTRRSWHVTTIGILVSRQRFDCSGHL